MEVYGSLDFALKPTGDTTMRDDLRNEYDAFRALAEAVERREERPIVKPPAPVVRWIRLALQDEYDEATKRG